MICQLLDRTIAKVLMFVAIGVSGGCSSVDGLKESKGEGVTEIFNYDFEKVWEAANVTMYALALPIVSSEISGGEATILASTPFRNSSWGENVAVFLRPIGDGKTSVEVLSKRVMAPNIYATDWTYPIFSQLNINLIRLNSKPEIYLVRSTYQKLTDKTKNQLADRYDVQLFSDKQVGRIVERQVEDLSTTGSTAGSDMGSSLASAVYINNALTSGSYNIWTDVAVGVLGGVAGAGGNKAAQKLYLLKYTIRNLDGELNSSSIYYSSPIGEPIGSCYSFQERGSVSEAYCRGMNEEDIRRKFLNPN
jgi:hypothetical protein